MIKQETGLLNLEALCTKEALAKIQELKKEEPQVLVDYLFQHLWTISSQKMSQINR